MKQYSHQNTGKETKSKEWMLTTNVKTKRSSSSLESKSFVVKRSYNNGQSGKTRASVLGMGERSWGGRREQWQLFVLSVYHRRFLARTGSDIWPSTHCRFKPQISCDGHFHGRFSLTLTIFSFSSSEPAVKIYHCRFTKIWHRCCRQ
jgi:hypothetical protein